MGKSFLTRPLFWNGSKIPDLSRRSCRDRRKIAPRVSLWEELAIGVLGPHGRTLIIGRELRINHPEVQRDAKYFAEKYGHSPYMEEQAKLTLRRVLVSLKDTLSGRQYLVGDAFTRADLTTAAMLMLLRPAPEEFSPSRIKCGESIWTRWLTIRPSPIFAWRDQMYKKHRGEAVRP